MKYVPIKKVPSSVLPISKLASMLRNGYTICQERHIFTSYLTLFSELVSFGEELISKGTFSTLHLSPVAG